MCEYGCVYVYAFAWAVDFLLGIFYQRLQIRIFT